uniref:Uncharacterized protein n=1 Tax=Trichuris muris TaxID=70415 RepID=A0A5S6R5L0_TRIMR
MNFECAGIARKPLTGTRREQQQRGVPDLLLHIYHSPFYWSFVKSVPMFIVGVMVARALGSLDIDKPMNP